MDTAQLIKSLPIQARNPAEGSTYLSLEDRYGNVIALTEDRDCALILESLLNRYMGTHVDEPHIACATCGTVQELRFLDDRYGLLTIEIPCILGAATKDRACPGMTHIPILRSIIAKTRSSGWRRFFWK